MFSTVSRYRELADEVAIDAEGRAVASKTLRSLPDVSGTFVHVVEDADRLDHLAFKYYDQPRDWWRIADANPEFPWPPELLGDDPRRTVVVPLVWEGPRPPWVGLIGVLRRTIGVETALLGSPERPRATEEIVEGTAIFDLDRGLTGELDDSVRNQVVTAALATALSANGLTIAGAVRSAKIDAATWRITGHATGQIYTFRDFPADDLLRVYESGLRYHWTVALTYNTLTTSDAHLVQLVEDQGFTAGPAAATGRIGKVIVIPPRTT